MGTSKNQATIGKLMPSGLTSNVWTVDEVALRTCEDLIKKAIDTGRITDAGIYLVCWLKNGKEPHGRVFTIDRVKDQWTVAQGLPATRVTHWPPR